MMSVIPTTLYIYVDSRIIEYRIYSSRRSSYKPSQAFFGAFFSKKILYLNNLINSVRLICQVQSLIIATRYGQSSVFKRIILVFFLVRQAFLRILSSVAVNHEFFTALQASSTCLKLKVLIFKDLILE